MLAVLAQMPGAGARQKLGLFLGGGLGGRGADIVCVWGVPIPWPWVVDSSVFRLRGVLGWVDAVWGYDETGPSGWRGTAQRCARIDRCTHLSRGAPISVGAWMARL
jgi:hypothetical protein